MGKYHSPFAFSPDGQTVVLCSGTWGHVDPLNMATRQIKGRVVLSHLQSVARDLAWSPDSRLLAISTQAHIELWHMSTLRFLYNLTPATLHARSHHVRFSADGQTLAVSLEEPDERGNSLVMFHPLGDSAAASLR